MLYAECFERMRTSDMRTISPRLRFSELENVAEKSQPFSSDARCCFHQQVSENMFFVRNCAVTRSWPKFVYKKNIEERAVHTTFEFRGLIRRR